MVVSAATVASGEDQRELSWFMQFQIGLAYRVSMFF
jgi:hypothetical protein